MTENGPSTFSCSVCRTQLVYTTKLKITPYIAEGFTGNERYQELVEKGCNTSSQFTCPKCKSIFVAEYQVALLKIYRVIKPEMSAESVGQTSTNTDEDAGIAQLVEECRTNGVLDAFIQTVKAQTVNGCPPVHMDRYFASFLRRIKPYRIPKPALRYFQKQYSGWIDFYEAQQIGMVLSNKRICRFVPIRSLNMDPRAGQNVDLGPTTIERLVHCFDFVQKTGVGYVPPEHRIFLESLRHAGGDKGRTMQGIRLNGNGRSNGHKT